jgi:hypothetical protein
MLPSAKMPGIPCVARNSLDVSAAVKVASPLNGELSRRLFRQPRMPVG